MWQSTGIGYPQSQEIFHDTEVFEAFTLASFYLIILGFSFVPQIPQTQYMCIYELCPRDEKPQQQYSCSHGQFCFETLTFLFYL